VKGEFVMSRSCPLLPDMSSFVEDMFSWENSEKTSASQPSVAPWRLLLFAALPKFESKFMRPSMRLRGLDLARKLLSLVAVCSCFDRENSNLMGPSFNSKRRGVLASDSGANTGWVFSQFSSPDGRRDVEGVELPWLDESLRARRTGLREGLLMRGDDRKGATRRRVNFLPFAVAGVCDARGEGGAGWVYCSRPWPGLTARCAPRGESGELGDPFGDLVVLSWKRDDLEGERDSERLNFWMAST
jgi:hypothetical protein